MILNNENHLLYSAGEDQKIIVWKVDCNKNELTFIYQQEKHTNCICAMSLNESENILITSGDDQQIIIWKFGQEIKFYFRKVFNQVLNCSVCHIKFITNDKFIWIPSSKDINCICEFDYQDGIYFMKILIIEYSSQNLGCALFLILYFKDQNVLIVRTKKQYIQSNNQWIFGTKTDDGKQLLFLDNHKAEYSLYELQYKQQYIIIFLCQSIKSSYIYIYGIYK
ncbi:unnamed protein product [Paramecium pentaurelia]|uniref:Uncharacterized protein n=1 Tax=Paramecium pentaurelia TaxID=43138 RepID=A0A8S1Y192_9CILI|nr:unnamed protein product [Paramecium pentaurelia]